MTSETIIAHIRHMARHDPSYAAKSLRWYAAKLPWLELPEFEIVIKETNEIRQN